MRTLTKTACIAALAGATIIAAGSAPLQNTTRLEGAGFLLELRPVTTPAQTTLSADGFTLTAVLTPAPAPRVPDLAAPFGVIDAADTAAFVGKMEKADPGADIAEPFGVIDAADFMEFTRRHEAAR